MKKISNHYLFSNFNTEIIPNSINKNSLTIKHIYNLTTENNIIEPLFNFSNFYKSYFSNDTKYNSFFENNKDIIKYLIYANDYAYFDSTSQEIKNRLFLLDNSLNLYELNNDTNIINKLDYKFTQFPIFEKFNNKLYIHSHNDLFLVITKNNKPLVITSPLNITSFVNYHNYSLFSTIDNKFSIYFTNDSELLNIEDSIPYSTINLPAESGAINKLILYKDNIYAIQQYGISKIILSDNSYKCLSLCSIQSKIYSETVNLIDDFIIFYTSSGLYLFDGNDIKQIFKNITSTIKIENLKSTVFNNKYFLIARCYINEILNNCLFEFDIENNICKIHNLGNLINIYLMQSLNKYHLIAIKDNTDGTYEIICYNNKYLIKTEKYLKFNKITFDNENIKVLNELKINSTGEFQITLSSDYQSSSFNISDIKTIKNIGLKGQIFEIEIQSNSAFSIESLLFTTTSYSEE